MCTFACLRFLTVWLWWRFAGMDGIGATNVWARGKQSAGWSNYQTVTPAYIGTQRDTALVLEPLPQLCEKCIFSPIKLWQTFKGLPLWNLMEASTTWYFSGMQLYSRCLNMPKPMFIFLLLPRSRFSQKVIGASGVSPDNGGWGKVWAADMVPP